MGRNAILVDFDSPDNWEFKKGLEQTTKKRWAVEKCISNKHTGIHKITRYIKYFWAPFKVFVNIKKYDNVLAWQQFFGLILVFYMRLFHVKHAPRINVMTFIYKPKRGLIGKAYKRFVRYAVSSGFIDHIFVYGSSEISYYAKIFKVSPKLFVAETLGIEDKREEFSDCRPKEKYYLAPGRSNRDYKFLRKIWKEENRSLVIISDNEKAEDLHNIRYETHCYEDDYLKYLSKAYAVIVPLKEKNISSGQLVFLQAAMMGKPVITTKNNTVYDYIEDGYNGLIIDKSHEDMKEALNKLDNESYYEEMSKRSRKRYEQRFSLYELGVRVGRKLKETDREI